MLPSVNVRLLIIKMRHVNHLPFCPSAMSICIPHGDSMIRDHRTIAVMISYSRERKQHGKGTIHAKHALRHYGGNGMTNSNAHGRANQHISATPRQVTDDALRTFPFRSGMPDDTLPDAPVFGMFEQVVNPLALDGLCNDSTPTWRRHDNNDAAEGDMPDDYNDATIATMASQPTDSHTGTSSDTLASSTTQRKQYDSMACTQADLHENGVRREGRAQESDVNIDGCQTDCGVSMRHSTSSKKDSNDDTTDARSLDDDAFIAPSCNEIMRAIVDAYASRGDGVGNAYARAVDDAMGWCDSDMSTALAFSKHVDVVRTAGIIGRNAVNAVSGLWDVDGGIGGMLASTRGYITGLTPYSNQRSVVYNNRDAEHGVTDHQDAMCETGVTRFQRCLIDIIGMLGDATGKQSVCTMSFPIFYPDYPLLVPLCDDDYDTHEWAGKQYWKKLPMHLGEDGRIHDDAWLTRRDTLPEDGTPVIAVKRNGELGRQWCAWTEDLHIAGLALGMLHDMLAERSGLLSLSIAERDGGDLVGTLKKVWEWCAAYAWYL